jgi:hypothetical protein
VTVNLAGAGTTGVGDWSGITILTGSGNSDTITGLNKTYALDAATPDKGSSGGLTWASFENITDTGTGIFNMGTGGSVTGTLNGGGGGTLNYGSYSTPVTVNLAGAGTTGVGSWTGIKTVTGNAANTNTVTGSGETYNLTELNAGNNGTVYWTSMENLTGGTGADTFTGAGGSITGALTDTAGTTTLNGLLTAGSVNISGAVVLGSDTVLTSAGINLQSAVNGGGFNLDLSDSGTSTLGRAVTNLASLTTDAVDINGGVVTTTGAQNYDGAVRLTDNTTLTGSTVTTKGTVVGGTHSLGIGGNAVFGDAAADTLTGLTTLSVSGTTTINTDTITSSGTQNYSGAVTLGSNTTLTGAGVTFSSTVGSPGTAYSLAVNDSGTTTFTGAVGIGGALASLTTDAGGTTLLGANVRAQGGTITFNDAVSLDAGPVTITDTGGTGVVFRSTVNGAQDLTLAVSGATTFAAAVGEAAALGDGTGASLTINSPGRTEFQSTVKTASGISQSDGAGVVTFQKDATVGAGDTASSFNGTVELGEMTLKSAGPVTFGNSASDRVRLLGSPVGIDTSQDGQPVTFNSRVDGEQAFTVDSRSGSTGGGAVAFKAAVGAETPLTGLTVDAGSARFDGTVRVGDQGLTVTATDTVDFADTVDAGGRVRVEAGANITTKGVDSAAGNIEIRSTGGDLVVSGDVSATGGGVSLISEAGRIYTHLQKPTDKDSQEEYVLDVAIAGYSSDPGQGVDLGATSRKAAIVVSSGKSLYLGSNAELTAGGTYHTGSAAQDDREALRLRYKGDRTLAGDPLDVAIYLKAGPDYYGALPPGGPAPTDPSVTVSSRRISINSTDGQHIGALVVDAANKVEFGVDFEGYLSRAAGTGNLPISDLQRIEVVSRLSPGDLDTVAKLGTLPHADDLNYTVLNWPQFSGADYKNYFDRTYNGYAIYLLRAAEVGGETPSVPVPSWSLSPVVPFTQAAPIPVVAMVNVVDRASMVERKVDTEDILGRRGLPHPDCMSEEQKGTTNCQTVGGLLAVDRALLDGLAARMVDVNDRLMPASETPEERKERMAQLGKLAEHWRLVNSGNLRQIQAEVQNTPGLHEWMEGAVEYVRILCEPLHEPLRAATEAFLTKYMRTSRQSWPFMRNYIELRLVQDSTQVSSARGK